MTREQIDAILDKLRAAGRSTACLDQIRCPLTRFYQWQINAKGYKGTNPAADLQFFFGRQPGQTWATTRPPVIPSRRGAATPRGIEDYDTALAPASSRSRLTSRIGGAPKCRLYSRLKCEASS